MNLIIIISIKEQIKFKNWTLPPHNKILGTPLLHTPNSHGYRIYPGAQNVLIRYCYFRLGILMIHLMVMDVKHLG